MKNLKLIYTNRDLDNFESQLWNNKISVNTKAANFIDVISFIFTFLILVKLFISLTLPWYFFVLIYPAAVLFSSILTMPLLYIIPKKNYEKKKEELDELKRKQEHEAVLRKFEAMREDFCSGKELRVFLEGYKTVEYPLVFKDKIFTVLDKLNILLDVTESNNRDFYSIQYIFKNYLSDIVNMIICHDKNKQFSNTNNETDQKILKLLDDFIRHIDNKIECMSIPNTFDVQSTINVYEKIFSQDDAFKMKEE